MTLIRTRIYMTREVVQTPKSSKPCMGFPHIRSSESTVSFFFFFFLAHNEGQIRTNNWIATSHGIFALNKHATRWADDEQEPPSPKFHETFSSFVKAFENQGFPVNLEADDHLMTLFWECNPPSFTIGVGQLRFGG